MTPDFFRRAEVYLELDRDFARGLRAIHENRDQKKQIAYFDEQLAKLSEQMKNPVYDAFAKGDAVDKSFVRHQQWVDDIVAKVRTFKGEIEKLPLPARDEVVQSSPALQRTVDLCSQQKELAISTLGELEKALAEGATKIGREHQNWVPNFAETKKKYEDAVRQVRVITKS